MRVLVCGAGAIGSVLGGMLAKAGHEVTLLGRAWHLDVIRRQGLAITGIWGDHQVRHLTLAVSPAEIPREPSSDWVFVCVKAHQTADIAGLLPTWLRPQTLVCAFQNGVGHYEALIRHVPSDRVALGRVIFGVELEPGCARVTVCADDVLIGAPDGRVPRTALEELAAALSASGIPARTTEEILTALWEKVLYNCALNGLSTLLEVPYGKLPEHAQARRVMEAIIEEAYQVAAGHRLALEPPTADAYRELLFARLIPATAAHQSSMLRDVRRGKPTEIEALNGAIVRMGREAGVSTPMNALVTRLVHAKEQFAGALR